MNFLLHKPRRKQRGQIVEFPWALLIVCLITFTLFNLIWFMMSFATLAFTANLAASTAATADTYSAAVSYVDNIFSQVGGTTNPGSPYGGLWGMWKMSQLPVLPFASGTSKTSHYSLNVLQVPNPGSPTLYAAVGPGNITAPTTSGTTTYFYQWVVTVNAQVQFPWFISMNSSIPIQYKATSMCEMPSGLNQ